MSDIDFDLSKFMVPQKCKKCGKEDIMLCDGLCSDCEKERRKEEKNMKKDSDNMDS